MWVKIDDGAPVHPKLLRAGPEAAWLWVAGLCYANRTTSDGVLPKDILVALYPSGGWTTKDLARLAAKLCAVGLWVDEGEVYKIHAYAEYQSEALRGAVEQRRKSSADRVRNWRARNTGGNASGNGVTERNGNGAVTEPPRASPVPPRPVHSPQPPKGLDVPSGAEQPQADPLKAAARAKLEAALARVGAPRLAVVDGGSDGR